MAFGMTGRESLCAAAFTRRCLTAALAWLLSATAGPVQGQSTPPGTLPLPVPATNDITIAMQSTVRGPGVLVTWPLPPDALSTAVTLFANDPGIAFPIAVDGAYADDFDRTLRFQFLASGTLGMTTRNRFVVGWSNVNAERTGRVGGEINLSNTGGLWVRDGGGAWTQRNNGLPRYLPYTNVVDIAASGDGTRLLALSSGAQIQNNPVGVYRAQPDGNWAAVAPDVFGAARAVARVGVHPDNAQRFAVGTRTGGLFVTTDGGATFTQWRGELDPGFPSPPLQPEVTTMLWTANRLYVAVRNFGLFVSGDSGASFTRLASLLVPDGAGVPQIPWIRSVMEDPGNADRILVGTTNGGLWESNDAGQTWSSLNGQFHFLPDDDPELEPDPNANKTVLTIDVDPNDPAVIVMGTLTQGFWRTTDGGLNWFEGASPFLNEVTYPVKPEVWHVLRHGGQMLALVQGFGLHESADGGQSWTPAADQPFNTLARRLGSSGGELLMATNGGGIFLPPVTFPLSATITATATDQQYRNLDLGLSLTFGPGSVTLSETAPDGSLVPVRFNVVCEDYQGWIVWRATGADPDNLTMIGRYDKNNPETCIEGYCGDDSFVQLPGCFGERRAACFDVTVPGQVSFYDDDIFNGFTYHYAVTPFDYGDTSLLTDPLALSTPMVYPARYAGDPLADGPGNRFAYQVNLEAQPAVDGREIYVYPNPLRRGAGIAGAEGEQVVWTNLPPESRVQVFTLAGDRVADLPSAGVPQQGGNIYWIARNDDNQQLAAGIYMWRVVMPERGDYWGKLVIIR